MRDEVVEYISLADAYTSEVDDPSLSLAAGMESTDLRFFSTTIGLSALPERRCLMTPVCLRRRGVESEEYESEAGDNCCWRINVLLFAVGVETFAACVLISDGQPPGNAGDGVVKRAASCMATCSVSAMALICSYKSSAAARLRL